MLGTCKATEVSKEATTTLDGAGDREALGKRTDLLRSTTCTTTPDYEGEKLQAAAGLRVCCARAAAGGGGRAQRAAPKRAANAPPRPRRRAGAQCVARGHPTRQQAQKGASPCSPTP